MQAARRKQDYVRQTGSVTEKEGETDAVAVRSLLPDLVAPSQSGRPPKIPYLGREGILRVRLPELVKLLH
jgi:hypothetical protein